jgi:hypothetical protein
MGMSGAGDAAAGSASAHYSMVENTCVSCHLSSNSSHTFQPGIGSCQDCHPDIEDFDFSGLQTDVDAMLADLLVLLEFQGSYHDGHPVVGFYPAAVAQATWNYILLSVEDASSGVHNPAYTKSLLDWSIQAAQPDPLLIEACVDLAAGDPCELPAVEGEEAEAAEGEEGEEAEEVVTVCMEVLDMLACAPEAAEAEAAEH